ncbi:MAG: hypothetical protein ACJATE_000276 [Bacteroidia bacterium]|jgi:hypothetical protein
MKPFLLSFFLLFALGEETFGQHRECKDCIEWKEGQPLKWSDFKETPKRLSLNEALTDSGMSIALKCDNNTSEVVVKCFFDRTKSWTKDKKSAYLLSHEQLHFDITELFVRKLRNQLASLGNDCQKLNDYVEKYYNENYKEYVAYQAAYDRESEHSIDKKKQAYWEQKVAQELEVLKPFASLARN